MSQLVRIDLDSVIAKVRTALENFPQVAGAYLFGSALELCRPESDIDVGLVLEPGINPDSFEADRLEAEIALALTPLDGHPFDIVVLNPHNIIFCFEVIKSGRLIYCRDRERITDVLEYVSRHYPDVYPRYRQALDEIMEEIDSFPTKQKEGALLWD
ncbi:MAG: nucleotidyltransferase domain-containing protein [Syntrophothermus sp.]|uniref:nucleotidyltransferase domain-containing protein n=1 Tax=Syntrophothermus sp. TaxID=2736299 RepID=UPI00257AC261|nr:nucleotidyltransferase domain-containing protein [Syntrophothermus sp.]NSW81659.1 nucleotidyltransferase domain-containing protein [Syntrophothermus sp.]